MRLTGGLDRGRRLWAPRGASTRPTSAKVREAIFNILGPPPLAAVLDLYAGTGALGIEALSRGARAVVFVERDPRALAALRRNLREVGQEEDVRPQGPEGKTVSVIGTDVRTALRRLSRTGDAAARFGWVFLDPPYAGGEMGAALAELSGGSLLDSCAVVVVEHDKRHRPAESVGQLFLTDRRSYGDTEVSFYRAGAS